MAGLREAAQFLKQTDDILVLCHQFPDGDTLGSAFALCRALQQIGKHAAVACSHEPGRQYRFLEDAVKRESFSPRAVVTVDVAAPSLLGEPILSRYGARVDLCLDHHASRQPYARLTYVDTSAAAAAEVIYELIPLLGAVVDEPAATCLYTALITDTNGFRLPNTTPRTMRIAADLMERGVDAARLNRLLLDLKSRGFLELERRALGSLRYFFGGLCAAVCLTREMIDACGVRDEETDPLPALPRQVEGVLVGVTLREKQNGDYRVSLRTQSGLNAAQICERFGGGGHPSAAGCTIHRPEGADPCGAALRRVVEAVGDSLRGHGIRAKEGEPR